jgi:hypothetical protein
MHLHASKVFPSLHLPFPTRRRNPAQLNPQLLQPHFLIFSLLNTVSTMNLSSILHLQPPTYERKKHYEFGRDLGNIAIAIALVPLERAKERRYSMLLLSRLLVTLAHTRK